MKKFFMTLSLAIVTMAAMAVPVKPGWHTLKLVDGTEVRVQTRGDENFHWLEAADGTCYVEKNGVYEEVSFETLTARRESRMARRSPHRAIYASTTDGLGQFGKMSMGAVPSIGKYTIPVVMVQFKDLKFQKTTTIAKMTRYYNEEGYDDEGGTGSVRDYFIEQSGGQFVPTFDVVGLVTLNKSYSYYGGGDDDEHLYELPGDVIAAAVEQGVDFSKYVVPAGDSNHKTGVPLLAMFYAGRGAATEYPDGVDYLWPCEWDDVEDPEGYGDYNDVHFNSFFIGNELGSGGGSLMGCAVFCHEFGHAMGLPDFYVTSNDGYSGDDPFGLWSIMDSGAYLDDDSRIPAAYNAYEKSYMGWLDLKVLDTTADEVVLANPENCGEGSAVIVRNSNTETFIIENHQPSKFFPEEFGEGVLVIRIAYNKTSWNNNDLNNIQSKKRACVLTANGAKMYYSAEKGNLYGYSKTAIGSLKTYSGGTKDIGIKKVTKNSDGTITLTLDGSSGGGGDDPVITPTGDYLFYESFNQCAGKGGNDNQWSGTIANATFQPDNEGWVVADDKAYGANKCAKFGTSSIVGSATTPAFTLNGTTTMTFKAGAWKSNNDGTTLLLSAEGGTVEPASVTMEKGSWTDYTVSVTGTGTVTITFEAEKGRFFLDEVFVKTPTTTGISPVTRHPSSLTDAWYTLDGRKLSGKPALKGIYIFNGKKVVVEK